METIPQSNLSLKFDWTKLHENLCEDLCKELYNYPSPKDIYSLSCTSKLENDRFYKYASISEQVKIYLELKSNNQQLAHNSMFFLLRPFVKLCFSSTAEIVADFPECRQGRFKALGENGRGYVNTIYGVKNDFALQRIREGKETFESANQTLSEKQNEIEALLKDYQLTEQEQKKIRVILDGSHPDYQSLLKNHRKPVLQCVLEGVISMQEAIDLTDQQLELIINMDMDGDIAFYKLTKEHVRRIILAAFNPFSHPMTKFLLRDRRLWREQAVELNQNDISTLDRNITIIAPGWAISTGIGQILMRYINNFTPNQILKAIKKTSSQKFNSLTYDPDLAIFLNYQRLLKIDDYLELTNEQVDWIKKYYYMFDQYRLSPAHNFNIIKNNNIFFTWRIQKAIEMDLLTAQQASMMTRDHKIFLDQQLLHLPAIATKYKLPKDEIYKIILNRSNPLWYGVLGWAVDDHLLTLEQVLSLTTNQIQFATDKSFKETIEKYQLTGGQAFNIILNEFNPLAYLPVQKAVPHYLTFEQAIDLTKEQVDSLINNDR